jgi:hypothetical protein
MQCFVDLLAARGRHSHKDRKQQCSTGVDSPSEGATSSRADITQSTNRYLSRPPPAAPKISRLLACPFAGHCNSVENEAVGRALVVRLRYLRNIWDYLAHTPLISGHDAMLAGLRGLPLGGGTPPTCFALCDMSTLHSDDVDAPICLRAGHPHRSAGGGREMAPTMEGYLKKEG